MDRNRIRTSLIGALALAASAPAAAQRMPALLPQAQDAAAAARPDRREPREPDEIRKRADRAMAGGLVRAAPDVLGGAPASVEDPFFSVGNDALWGVEPHAIATAEATVAAARSQPR